MGSYHYIFVIMLLLSLDVVLAEITLQDGNHPRIFVGCSNCETVEKIQSRCGIVDDLSSEYQDFAAEYASIKSVAEHTSYDLQVEFNALDDKNQARIGLTYAFTYLVEGIHLDRVKWFLDNINTWSDTGGDGWWALYNAGIAYDWAYNGLTDDERLNYSAALSSQLSDSPYYSNYQTFPGNYNYRKYMTWLYGVIGPAIYDEEPVDAATYWNRMYTIWERINLYSIEINKDGAIYPIGGSSYAIESGWMAHVLAFANMKYTGLGGPEIDNLSTSVNAGIPYGAIYQTIQDEYYIPIGDSIFLSGFGGPVAQFTHMTAPISILAKEYEGTERGKLIAYTVDKLSYGIPEQNNLIFEVLFVDKDANALGSTFSNLSQTRVFDDTELVYREGFSLDSDSDELYFTFDCPKPVSSHTGYAKGHINLWRGRTGLTFRGANYVSTAEPYPSDFMNPYMQTSVSANNFLVYDPVEDYGAAPDEGGQFATYGDGHIIHQTDEWNLLGSRDPGGSLDLGSMDRSAYGNDYFYARYLGVENKLYSGTKMDSYSRSVARIGDYFVVLDRWDGDTSTNFTKRQIWQAPDADNGIEGGTWSGSAPDEVDSTTRNFYWDINGDRLHVSRVFPEPSATAYNRRIGAGGGGFPEVYQVYSLQENLNFVGNYDDEAIYGMWRLEFEETGQEDALFLTVLYPTNDSTPMPTVYPIGSSSSGNFVGVEIDNPDGNDALFIFSNNVSESTSESFSPTVNLQTVHDVLVADLEPDNYTINGEDVAGTIDTSVFFQGVSLSESNSISNSTAALSTCSSVDVSGNSIVEKTELVDYISQWKSGSISIDELFVAITEMKEGCN